MPFLQLFIIRIFQYFHILFFQLRCICIPSKKRVPVRKVKRYLHSFLFSHIWSHFPVKSQDGVSVQGLPGNGLPAEDMLTILPDGISRPWQSRSKNGWTRTLPHRLHIRYFRIFSIWMRNIYPPCSKQIQECPRHSCCEMHVMQCMTYSSVHLCNPAGGYIRWEIESHHWYNFVAHHLQRWESSHIWYNITPSRYVGELRLNMAKNLMQNNPELRVKNVAELVGFTDYFYFSRVFKSHEGVTPSQYIKSISNTGSAPKTE